MKWLVNLDLSRQQLLNAAMHNDTTAPTPAVKGQLYFNTTTNKLYVYNGTIWETSGDTYAAGTGLSLVGGTFNHSNSVSAGTVAEGGIARTLAWGGAFNVPSVTYDAQGHITSTTSIALTLPSNPNTDTATATDNILKGSNTGTAITYAPYETNESANAALRFYTHATNPTSTHRLNVNAYFYATRLHEGGTRVSLDGHTHSYAGSASAGGAANSVANNLVLKLDNGATEGTSLYTFNGSVAKTLDLKSGTNVTITAAAGTATFSSPNLSLGTQVGTGNAVTDIAVSGHQVTVTKGATFALATELHARSHTMTSTSDHTATNWRVFHSNGSGQVVELALGASGTVLKSNGAAAAPTWQADNDTITRIKANVGGSFASGDHTFLGSTGGAALTITESPALTYTFSVAGTDLGITAGTTAGPIVTSSTGNNATLPTATGSASGVVTTGDQTFAGVKTFSSIPVLPAADPTLANQAVRKSYVDGLLSANDAMAFKGTVGTGGTLETAAFNSLSTYNAGWTYKVITADTHKGKVTEIGDMLVAIVTRAGTGNVDADWAVIQSNIDGAVTGPASVGSSGNIAVFSGTSGKVIADSKVLLTQPATSATITVANGKTLTADNSITLTGTDATSLTLHKNLTVTNAYDFTLTATGAARTLEISGANKTLAGAATTLTFGGNFTTSGAHTTTFTTTANTAVTLPTSGTLTSVASNMTDNHVVYATGANSLASEAQLGVARGGTGIGTYAAGDILYATGATTLAKLAKGTAGQLLTMNTGATAPEWATGVRKYTAAVGDATNTSYILTHNFGTRDVTVSIRRTGTPYDLVMADVEMTSTNTITVLFAAAPTASEYTVTITG